MNDWLDSWTKKRTLPPEWRRAQASAGIGQPGFRSARDLDQSEPQPKRVPQRAPMEWPTSSLAARQTSMLRWLESLGHKVDYGPERRDRIPQPKLTAAETKDFLTKCAERARDGQGVDPK